MANLNNKVVSAHKMSRRVSGAEITLTRGASSVVLTAIPGNSDHTVEIGDIVSQTRTLDYLVLASELVLGGVETVPQRGDTITDANGTHPILAIGGEPGWRYNDQTRTVIRIHAKEL